MEEKKIYTAGELGRLTGVSARTIRFYDKKALLKPVGYSDSGYRLYNQESILQLQRIRVLQYIGLSLDEIREQIRKAQNEKWEETLWRQKLKLEEKKQQMEQMISLLDDTIYECRSGGENDIQQVTDLLKLIHMEKPFDYGYYFYQQHMVRNEEWFQWTFDKLALTEEMHILDMGCGHGNLWVKNWNRIPAGTTITLVDKRNVCIEYLKEFYRDHKRFLQDHVTFQFMVADMETNWKIEETYDRVVANHLWKFIEQPEKLMERVKKVLHPGGFLFSTYSVYGLLEAIQEVLDQTGILLDLRKRILQKKEERLMLEDQMRRCFERVDLETFSNRVEGLDHPEDLLAYIKNCEGRLAEEHRASFKEYEQKLKNEWKDYAAWEAEIITPLYRCFAQSK